MSVPLAYPSAVAGGVCACWPVRTEIFQYLAAPFSVSYGQLPNPIRRIPKDRPPQWLTFLRVNPSSVDAFLALTNQRQFQLGLLSGRHKNLQNMASRTFKYGQKFRSENGAQPNNHTYSSKSRREMPATTPLYPRTQVCLCTKRVIFFSNIADVVSAPQ